MSNTICSDLPIVAVSSLSGLGVFRSPIPCQKSFGVTSSCLKWELEIYCLFVCLLASLVCVGFSEESRVKVVDQSGVPVQTELRDFHILQRSPANHSL